MGTINTNSEISNVTGGLQVAPFLWISTFRRMVTVHKRCTQFATVAAVVTPSTWKKLPTCFSDAVDSRTQNR